MPEETIFIERRISHYRAMLKLRLGVDDRATLDSLLAEAQSKLEDRRRAYSVGMTKVSEPPKPLRVELTTSPSFPAPAGSQADRQIIEKSKEAIARTKMLLADLAKPKVEAR